MQRSTFLIVGALFAAMAACQRAPEKARAPTLVEAAVGVAPIITPPSDAGSIADNGLRVFERPARLVLRLPDGPAAMDVYQIILAMKEGRVEWVSVLPGDQQADFQKAVDVMEGAATSWRVNNQTRVRKRIAELRRERPVMDYFSRFLSNDCIGTDLTVSFQIRPTVSMKTWYVSATVGHDPDCRRVLYPDEK
jgi:hypothetical protein